MIKRIDRLALVVFRNTKLNHTTVVVVDFLYIFFLIFFLATPVSSREYMSLVDERIRISVHSNALGSVAYMLPK